MEQHGAPSDGESQPHAISCPFSGFINAKERIKDSPKELVWNARTLISHLNNCEIPPFADCDGNL
jgi:hypothetical protein